MCGLCGSFTYRGQADAPFPASVEIDRMCDAMRSRGPDGSGAWRSPTGEVSLGHLRLAIIDLTEDGAQPFTSADGRFTIVFNGEIYNYRELRAELQADGAVFKSRSDTEVIVELYRSAGGAAFRKLRGMFALAIWDEQTGELVLARDPFGIKPLYVADDGGTLRFASQVKALLAGGGVARDLDPAGQVGFFVWGHVPEPFTLYRDIQAFPPGHYRIITRSGAARPVPYATLAEVMRRASGAAPQSDAARREIVRSAVGDSIRYHHVADVPVGIFLSAGIDSATIAATSTEQGERGATTFTLGFEEYRGGERDETRLAEQLAHQLGSAQVTRWVSPDDFGGSFDHLVASMDQPSIDGVNTFLVSKLAAGEGLKVVLSGLGGDEMFGGYPSFADVPRMVAFANRLPGAGRLGPGFRVATAGWIGRFTSPKYAGLFEYGSGLFGAYLLRRALHMPWELTSVLDPELVLAGLERLELMEGGQALIEGIDNPHAAVTVLEMHCYMRDRLLRDSDWASMAHSLELRVPLVDWALFEALAPLIASARPPTKADLAAVPRLPLPSDVLSRPKTGFEVPVRDWLQRDETRGGGAGGRGLRDWSRVVYERFVPQ